MPDIPVAANKGNRYDLRELAGAFGDLGTLIPFVAAYIAIVKLDPAAVLLGFGLPLIVVGAVYRTPFPVQPQFTVASCEPVALEVRALIRGRVLLWRPTSHAASSMT